VSKYNYYERGNNMALANNPLKPTQALANVIGSKPISRPQAVKLV
jgi:chromatin remodeling complex protein RSC6